MDRKILDLRSIFGVEAEVTTSASSTDGAYVEMECTAGPGSGTMVHYHPDQDESFEVVEGALEILRGGRWIRLAPGDAHTVPRGEVHAWRNPDQAPARFRNVHRPAGGFEAHLDTLDRLVRTGKVRSTTDIRSVIHMSMSAAEHRPDVTVKPPQWLVHLMAFIGRRLGFKLGGYNSIDGCRIRTVSFVLGVRLPGRGGSSRGEHRPRG